MSLIPGNNSFRIIDISQPGKHIDLIISELGVRSAADAAYSIFELVDLIVVYVCYADIDRKVLVLGASEQRLDDISCQTGDRH